MVVLLREVKSVGTDYILWS